MSQKYYSNESKYHVAVDCIIFGYEEGKLQVLFQHRNIEPYNIEGRDNGTWLVLDYSNVIVHIFGREAREFYNLDKLYED